MGLSLAVAGGAGAAVGDPVFLQVSDADANSDAVALPADAEARYPVRMEIAHLTEEPSFLVRDENGDTLVFERTELERQGHDGFVWRGRVMDLGQMVGTATLTVSGRQLAGRFHGPHGYYRITSDRQGRVWLDRLDLSTLPEERHPPEPARLPGEEEAPEPVMGPMPADHEDEPVVVDLMAYYTDAALEQYDSEASLRLALRNTVDSANTAYLESQVDHRVRLLGVVHLDFNEPANNMGSGLSSFASNSSVASVDALYGPDLQAKYGRYEDYCGIAYTSSQYRDSSTTRYSVNNAFAGYPCFEIEVLAHEMGHNMGLHHDPDNGPLPGSMIEPFAYGHVVVGEFQTVMAYYPGCGGGEYTNCPPAYVFSNPDVNDPIAGLPSGIEGERDNAEVLRRSMPHVRHWGQQPATLAEGAGDTSNDYRTQGAGHWVAQDEVRWNDAPALVSGPVFGSETSVLVMEPASSEAFTLSFRLRGEADGDTDGQLTVTADGEERQVIDAPGPEWTFHHVTVPADTDTVAWRWQAPARPSADDTLGVVYLADVAQNEVVESQMAGRVEDQVGEPVAGVTVSLLDPDGSQSLGGGTTDGDGRFQATVSHAQGAVPEQVSLAGPGVATATQSAQDCIGAAADCTLVAEGASRTLSGEIRGLLAGEQVTLTLGDPLADDAFRAVTVTANSNAEASYDVSVDALLEYGPFDVVGSGYVVTAEPGDGINARDGDVGGLDIELATNPPAILSTGEASITADGYSIEVEVDSEGRDTELELTATPTSDDDAASGTATETVTGDQGVTTVSLQVEDLDCGSDYAIQITATNDHGQTAAPVDSSVSTDDCANGGGGSSGCSIGGQSRVDPVFILVLMLATAGLIRRRRPYQAANGR